MDRIEGALLGLACGDALGAPIEFLSKDEAVRAYGRVTDMKGGGLWQPGEWTDDTAMALCVADGILEDPLDPVPPAGLRFCQWLPTAKDVGDTIRNALVAFARTGSWPKAASATPQARAGKAAGNGSLMRTLPVAVAYPDTGKMLLESARISAMTHWDPQAEVCCAIYCLWIRELLSGADMDRAWNAALAEARKWASRGRLSDDSVGPSPLPDAFWPRLQNLPALTYEQLQPSGFAGYVVECLEAAVWCCRNASSAEEAIVNAVNLAGEADTMGAVAGGAAGACFGRASLPERWLGILFERERIEQTAARLAALRAAPVRSARSSRTN